MDAFKGVFRRANQSVKEKTGRAEVTHDGPLEEAIKRVRLMERTGGSMMNKVQALSRCFEELGGICVSIAEDYKQTMAEPHTAPEMQQLAGELHAYGQEVMGKAQELQRNLRENAFDNIGAFVREVPSIKHMEEDRKKKQLEYDFFREKVAGLIRDPPKDSTRIPRNEGIRENWRQQLHQATENMKQNVSQMHSNGQRALDASLYTVSMSMGNYMGYALNSAKNHFVNARLPAYPTAPLLAPAPLPPPPPPYQPPQQQQGGYGQQPPPGQQPQQGQYGSPQHGQQPPQQQQQYASPQHGGAPQGHNYTSPGPQGATPQQGQQQNWNNNTSFGQQPAAPPAQPAQVNYGYDQQQQGQPQHQQPQQQQQPWGSPQAQQQQQPQSQTPPQQQQQQGGAAPWNSAPPQQQQAPAQQPHQQQGGDAGAPWSSPPQQQQQQPPAQQQQGGQAPPWAS